MKPQAFKKRITNKYKTTVDEKGRVCTKCGIYKSWIEFNSAKTKHIKIKKTASCKKCKHEHRKSKGRNYKVEKASAKEWKEHLKKTDPYLLKARNLRQGLLTRTKDLQIKSTTPTTEVLYNWFLQSTPIYCYYSGVELNLLKKSNNKLTVDHKIPLTRGGSNNIDNLCFASHHMNTAKGSLTEQEFKQFLELISSWEDKGITILRRLKQGHF